jgi:hypothetical protein
MSAAVAKVCATAWQFHDEVHKRRDQSSECAIAADDSACRSPHEDSRPLHEDNRLVNQQNTPRTVR